MASLTSTQFGSSADYLKYIYENPVKTDRTGDVDILEFSLAPVDDKFVRLTRGAYITLRTSTYGVWFTGFITNDPQYTYLGKDGVSKLPVWGYKYTAQSDEIILSEQSFGIIPPFMNRTQGQILAALSERLLPGYFDTTGIQDGQFLPRYVVDPTKKFSDIIKEFSDAALYRFSGKARKLSYVPQDATPSVVVVDPENDRYFTPDALDIQASNLDITNEAIVIGGIEPQTYVTEYFLGDGATAQFPLMSAVFGVESALLLDETFSQQQLDTSVWTVFDLPSPSLQVSNGFLNVLGGSKDGQFNVHLDSANLLPVSGNLRLTHGDYDFIDAATTTGLVGVIGGLWTQTPNAALQGCLYGLAVTRATGGVLTLNPINAGVIDHTQSQVINFNMRYVLRSVMGSSSVVRSTQEYHYYDQNGTLQVVGGNAPSSHPQDFFSITHIISEIDPVLGLITDRTTYPKSLTGALVLDSLDSLYALYVPAASSDLFVTLTNITLDVPMQGSLSARPKGSTQFTNRLIGANEVDALDGVTPVGTITQSGGVVQKSTTLGTPQYAVSNPTLAFYKDSTALTDTIPNVAEMLQLNYRAAGAAIARVRNRQSVDAEAAAWGDSGVRSVTQNSATPQPQTSADCEAAAAAIVGELSRIHYEGTYTVFSDYVTGEPQASTNLTFQHMDTNQFSESTFAEIIYQVKSTFVSEQPHEIFSHEVSFGKASDQEQLRKVLAKITSTADVFAPQDSAQVPTFVPSENVGTAYAPDALFLSLFDFDENYYYVTIPVPAPAGGGFEVRYTDDSWGPSFSNNLLGRFAGNSFILPRNAHGKTAFVRAYEPANYLVWSEDFTQGWDLTGGGSVFNTLDVNPNQLRVDVSNVVLKANEGAVLSQAVTVQTGAKYNVCFSVSLKGQAGREASIRIVDQASNSYTNLVCTLNGNWQRFSVTAEIDPNGVSGSAFNVGGFGAGKFASINTVPTTLIAKVLCDESTDLPIQISMASFQNNTSVETAYYQTMSTPYGPMSRYSSAIRLSLPLIPPAPTATVEPSSTGQAYGTDPTVQPGLTGSGMVVSPVIPTVAIDVWGFEIRGADNETVLYHTDLTSSSYQPSVTFPTTVRNPSYNVYTYNLFGEYSPAFLANQSMNPPSIADLVVNDITELLLWQATNATAFRVRCDSVDATFTHLTFDITVTTNFIALQDSDFFPARWFRVTPMDALGSGTPLVITHQFAPLIVDEFDTTNQVVSVTPPATPGAAPTVPAPFGGFSAQYIQTANQIYNTNININ